MPLVRTPTRIDAWLNSSEITRDPLPTKAGMNVEFVANPIELINESSMPTKRATRASAVRCSSFEPPSKREPHAEIP